MKKKPFSEANVCVTLTGAEWFTIVAVFAGREKDLNADGLRLLRRAKDKLNKQLNAAPEMLT